MTNTMQAKHFQPGEGKTFKAGEARFSGSGGCEGF